MKSKNGFTKTDLVVVLICIIFLVANIAAVGESGRKRAKEAVCLANLLKWGQIFQAYTADNDGFFHARTIGSGYNKLWPYIYKPYYVDKMLRFCPAAANPMIVTGTFGTWNYRFGSFRPLPNFPMPGEREYDPFNANDYVNGHFTGSYGMNRYIDNLKGGTLSTDPAYWRRVDAKNGAQVPVFMDSPYAYFSPIPTALPPPYDGAFQNEMQWICINRHTGYVNACFLDFSARKIGLKELWTLKWSRTSDTCGQWTTCGGVQSSDWPPWMRDFQDY